MPFLGSYLRCAQVNWVNKEDNMRQETGDPAQESTLENISMKAVQLAQRVTSSDQSAGTEEHCRNKTSRNEGELPD